MENAGKLTAQIAGAYWGAKVKIIELSHPYDIHPIAGLMDIGLFVPNYIGTIFTFEKCRLILKPLSEISDEDSKGVVGLMAGADYGELDIDDVPEWLNEVIGGNSALTADYVSGWQMLLLMDFLRSKGYDCGYGEIPSLIKAGIAISQQ